MNMLPFFKSLADLDNTPLVLCDTEHRIVYMNAVACEHYRKYGGEALVGKSLLHCHNEASKERIRQVLAWFRADAANNRVHTFYSERENKDVYMVALREESGELIGYYEKHEYRSRDLTSFYDLGTEV